MPTGFSSGSINQQVHSVAQAALNLLFPPRCAGCGKPGQNFCATCAESLQPIGLRCCVVCGEPLDQPGNCSRCQTETRAFRRVRSAFRFDGSVRRAIHRFKYDRRRYLAQPLALIMADALDDPPREFALCGVPLHPARLAERGFNQSYELAHYLSLSWNVPCLADNTVRRIRVTRQQVDLDYASRQANVAGAFAVASPEAIRDRVIVMVDDVCTTGATLDACARALLAGGAQAVEGVTLAR